ncbi:MAG: FixH family protein [Stenotrophomonas sp.]
MFWLVVGLPLLLIVAGVGLVIVAVRSGGADVVSDPVQRVSQIQTTDLGPDEAAAKLGLSAVLRVEDGVVEVLAATGKFGGGTALQLVLEHPTRESDDLRLELLPQGPGWRVQQAVDGEHDWVVQLRDADGRWRLHGRLPKQQHAARLSPSLGGDH